VCKLYLLFISADAAQEEKMKMKVLLPTGVSKSAAHTVLLLQSVCNSKSCPPPPSPPFV
jgi:hypothetical protein